MSGTPFETAKISRRSWLATSIAGMLVGGIWGAGIGALASPKNPTIAVIGRDTFQIVLLDTLSVRVLFILGIPNQDLIDQIPALMTMLRQRIDIVIGMPSGLATLGHSFGSRWNVNHSIVIPENLESAEGPTSPTQSTLTRSTSLDLDESVSIDIDITSRDGWNGLPPTFLWSATIVQGSNTVLLAADDASLLATTHDRPSLIIAPVLTISDIGKKLAPGSIALNSDDQQDVQDGEHCYAIAHTHPEDIARFVFGAKGIELPPWATSGI